MSAQRLFDSIFGERPTPYVVPDGSLELIKSILTPRQWRVLELRFCLEPGDTRRMRTLEEVAREFHVTRERIRQIEQKSLRQIRGKIGKQLKDLTNADKSVIVMAGIKE